MSDLNYSKLKIQEYLKLQTIDRQGAKTPFKYRVRMANYGENFRGSHGPVMVAMAPYVVYIWTTKK